MANGLDLGATSRVDLATTANESLDLQSGDHGLKIDRIRTYHLRDKLEQPFGFSQWYYGQRNSLLVEIVTDQGVSGWGECYGPADLYQATISSFYAPRLIGQNPLLTDKLWHDMWRSSLDFARGGIMMGAMSGLDMALWDLKGKYFQTPVCQLIGGKYRDAVPCYATGMYFQQVPEDQLLDNIITEAIGHYQQGFQSLKIKVGKNLKFDARQIIALRKALPDAGLMADSNHAYDLTEAIKIGHLLAEHDYGWFEEPLSPEYQSQFRQLHDKVDVPIATGECEQTRYGFQRLLSTGGVQIAQPDLAYCGGISEALKIKAIASALGVTVIPHCWGTMLNIASATHFLAAMYREPGRLEDAGVVLELDRTPNPLRDQLFEVAVTVEDGAVKVPTAPGLGVQVDRDALQAFLVSEKEVQ